MIKFSSIGFVICLVVLFASGLMATFFPSVKIFPVFLNISAFILLIMGVLLIIALIIDRFNDAKSEDDDYKKY